MSPNRNIAILCFISLFCLTAYSTPTSRRLTSEVKDEPIILKYHKGPLLKGNMSLNIIWYGHFTSPQRAIILDFINSLSTVITLKPSTSSWWKTTERYHGQEKTSSTYIALGKQITLENYPLGKMLSNHDLVSLASKPVKGSKDINVVLTAKDVNVDGFCSRNCGTHEVNKDGVPYVWVGNAEIQCPGDCAWPFHQAMYGPKDPPLVAPNGDVGIEGMIINLATELAATVTNPFNNGYYQGVDWAPLEAVSACAGIFGSGAYPGYPGRVLVDKVSGASFNAYGVNERKYFLPAMWDPVGSTCKTLL